MMTEWDFSDFTKTFQEFASAHKNVTRYNHSIFYSSLFSTVSDNIFSESWLSSILSVLVLAFEKQYFQIQFIKFIIIEYSFNATNQKSTQLTNSFAVHIWHFSSSQNWPYSTNFFTVWDKNLKLFSFRG